MKVFLLYIAVFISAFASDTEEKFEYKWSGHTIRLPRELKLYIEEATKGDKEKQGILGMALYSAGRIHLDRDTVVLPEHLELATYFLREAVDGNEKAHPEWFNALGHVEETGENNELAIELYTKAIRLYKAQGTTDEDLKELQCFINRERLLHGAET